MQMKWDIKGSQDIELQMMAILRETVWRTLLDAD